jgi:hypothetical protein
MAAVGGALIVVGCVLQWWHVGGTPGIPADAGNGLEGSGIVVFLVGIATLALLALPYAAGDRPVGFDRWLSFAILAAAGWIGFGWHVVELFLMEVFTFREPVQVLTNGPGLWMAGIGLVILARSTYVMTGESAYR